MWVRKGIVWIINKKRIGSPSIINAKGCSETTIASHGPGLGLLVLVQFVKPVSETHLSERVDVRYGQDMERKEVREGHSLWLGHRKKERKKTSVVQVCHSSKANIIVSTLLVHLMCPHFPKFEYNT